MTPEQKRIIQGIVNIFETGSLAGKYGAVAVIAGDAGHLTYGRSQTTLAGGGLFALIRAYCSEPAAAWVAQLRPYLARLEAKDLTLDDDAPLRAALKQAGGDPVMRRVQDEFFDTEYWERAVRSAAKARHGEPLLTALGMLAVYDSTIHGSFGLIRDRVNAALPAASETEWVANYVAQRRDWMAHHSNTLLQKCVYRMDEINKLIAAGNWELKLPITVRGISVSAEVLAAAAAQTA